MCESNVTWSVFTYLPILILNLFENTYFYDIMDVNKRVNVFRNYHVIITMYKARVFFVLKIINFVVGRTQATFWVENIFKFYIGKNLLDKYYKHIDLLRKVRLQQKKISFVFDLPEVDASNFKQREVNTLIKFVFFLL